MTQYPSDTSGKFLFSLVYRKPWVERANNKIRKVLKCMAQGLAAMEHGSEIVDGTPWEEGTDEWNDEQRWQRENEELVHFDIKPLNSKPQLYLLCYLQCTIS